jgi:hypothetical protein
MKLAEAVLFPEKSIVDSFNKILINNKSGVLFHLRRGTTRQNKAEAIANFLNGKVSKFDIKFVADAKDKKPISKGGGVGADNIINIYIDANNIDWLERGRYDLFVHEQNETIKHELIHVAQNKRIFKAGKSPEITMKYKNDLQKYFSDKLELMAYAAGLVDYLKSKGAPDKDIANFQQSKYLQNSIFLVSFNAALEKDLALKKRFLKYIYGYMKHEV